MTLPEYRDTLGYSYGRISRETGVAKSIIYRLCTTNKQGLSLKHAYAIVQWSKKSIRYEDLLNAEA